MHGNHVFNDGPDFLEAAPLEVVICQSELVIQVIRFDQQAEGIGQVIQLGIGCQRLFEKLFGSLVLPTLLV